jgi:RNA polymerase sigma-70 factor (ECF subfamily)
MRSSTSKFHHDEKLIEGLKTNKFSSFEEFYDLFAPAFYGDIKRALFKEDVSTETLNTVFITLFKSIDTFDPEKERFFTWASKIVRGEIRKQKTKIVLKELFLCQNRKAATQPVNE